MACGLQGPAIWRDARRMTIDGPASHSDPERMGVRCSIATQGAHRMLCSLRSV